MNFVWTVFAIISLIVLLIVNPEMAFSSFLSGGEKGITLSLKLWGIYAVWLGILKIVEDTKLDKKLAKLLNPIIKLLFGQVDNDLKEQLSINITANLFGMGNACTPSGINSMSLMDKGETYITSSMATLLILNSANLQVIPTTVIGLRVLRGSTMPSIIILPTIIGSLASIITGIVLVKICSKIFKSRKHIQKYENFSIKTKSKNIIISIKNKRINYNKK